VRGLRHLQHRPKLVVVDDPEDGELVRTKENRDKADRWLHSEVMPGLDARKGKLVVIGKRARLQVVAPYIKNGTVLFPRSGCEELLGQIFNIGVESHDDLNDALVYHHNSRTRRMLPSLLDSDR
jgi:hypothetical protein